MWASDRVARMQIERVRVMRRDETRAITITQEVYLTQVADPEEHNEMIGV